MDSIYSYLDNIDVTICPDDPDLWFIQNKCYDVGFDTESKPLYPTNQTQITCSEEGGSSRGAGVPRHLDYAAPQSHLLAIIQIATPTNVLIYRVFNVPVDKWPRSLINFLQDAQINKYCVDSRQDEQLLTDLGVNVQGLIDLQIKANTEKRMGMKQLASTLLGLKLDKSKNIQAGDWSKYPLTVKQIEYAATDAVVCLALAEQLQLTPKKLIRTTPVHSISVKGDKPEMIINLLIACIKYRKKELKLEPDSQGFILLSTVSQLIEFKRLYTTLEEIKLTIINDKKRRLILLNDNYKLRGNGD